MAGEIFSFLFWILVFYLIFSVLFMPGGIGVLASLAVFLFIFVPVFFGTLVLVGIVTALLLE